MSRDAGKKKKINKYFNAIKELSRFSFFSYLVSHLTARARCYYHYEYYDAIVIVITTMLLLLPRLLLCWPWNVLTVTVVAATRKAAATGTRRRRTRWSSTGKLTCLSQSPARNILVFWYKAFCGIERMNGALICLLDTTWVATIFDIKNLVTTSLYIPVGSRQSIIAVCGHLLLLSVCVSHLTFFFCSSTNSSGEHQTHSLQSLVSCL